MQRHEIEKIYREQDPGHYYRALQHGNPVQRFWHRYKFGKAARTARLHGHETVLDCGCGSGTLLPFLPKSVHVTAMDISAKNVAFATKMRPGTKGITGSVETTKLPRNAYDVIFFIEVLEHLKPEDEATVLRRFHDALKPGGRLILTTPNYRSLWPVIEKIWNRLNPIDYAELHINRKNPASLVRSLHHAGFSNVQVQTFFVLSPFIALVSQRLARGIARIEERLLRKAGSIIIVRAEKQDT